MTPNRHLTVAGLALGFSAGGCAGPASTPSNPGGTDTPPVVAGDDDDDDVVDTDPPGTTGDTGGSTTPADCSAPLPLGPLPFTTIPVRTEEDFDFDLMGRLVAQNNTSLVGYYPDGSVDVISPNVGTDAAGIRALPTGDYVVAQPDTGVVKLVLGATGGTRNAGTGFTSPNGLELGEDGIVYVAEYSSFGGLVALEPYSEAQERLLDRTPVNGVALSPDESTLYVSSRDYFGGANGFDGVAELVRDANGQWGPLTTLVETSYLIQGLTTDVCGNLYAVNSQQGLVVRYNIADGSIDELANLQDGGLLSFFSGARFSPGIGGFSRTALYITDRTQIYVIEVGIEGRHVLAPAR